MKYLKLAPDLTETVSVNVDEIQALPLPGHHGVSVKPIMQTHRLTADKLIMTQSGLLPANTDGQDRTYYLLSGETILCGRSNKHKLEKNGLLFVPGRENAGLLLELLSPEVQFLVLTMDVDNGKPPIREYGTWVDDRVLVVQPEDPPAYEPANHDRTVNRCLFINDAIEVIHGQIDIGGGADEHAHKDFDQLTYVMEPGPELLLYNPPGVLHAGGTYDFALDLVVIYSPPYRESLKYGT